MRMPIQNQSRDSPANERILYSDGKGMSDMQTAGDVRWRERHNKGSLRFRFAICSELGREEAFSLPPVIPC